LSQEPAQLLRAVAGPVAVDRQGGDVGLGILGVSVGINK
jgi:hypothetical protein